MSKIKLIENKRGIIGLIRNSVKLSLDNRAIVDVYSVEQKFIIDVSTNNNAKIIFSCCINTVELNNDEEDITMFLESGTLSDKVTTINPVHIQLGERGTLLLYRTDDGYVIDVFKDLGRETEEFVEGTYFFDYELDEDE